MRQATVPHLPLFHHILARLAGTLDTRITCSVEWGQCQYQYCVERPEGTLPEPVKPSKTAKNGEQRTFSQGVRGDDGSKGGEE